MTEIQQQIYNSHLAISRRSRNKPFKLRRDFSSLDEGKRNYLEKLERFFNSNPKVDINLFFEAPYRLFDDGEYYDLEFFTRPKAVKTYTQYLKQLEIQNPDNQDALVRLRDGLKFVHNFCLEKGLTFDEYGAYCEGSLPCCIQHLKDHEINFYVLHSLGIKVNMEKEILDFIFDDFHGTYQKTRNKYLSSKKMKKFSELAISKLLEKQTTEKTK